MKVIRNYKNRVNSVEDALLLPIEDASEYLLNNPHVAGRNKRPLAATNKVIKKVRKISPELREELIGRIVEEKLPQK